MVGNKYMQSIKKIKQIKDSRILVRVDFNVPIENKKVRNDFKIQAALPTINYLRKKGAKIILVSHISGDGTESLAPVALYLNKFFSVTFVPDVIGKDVITAVSSMKSGDVILLENLRKEAGEKENSKFFTVALASLGDIYVNEAFPECHREYASIVGVPKVLPSYAGLHLEKEIEELSLISSPKQPFVALLGGAKFSTKLPLISKFLQTADSVFVGGALANTLLKAQGKEIGVSLTDEVTDDIQKVAKNKKLVDVTDVVVIRDDQKKTVSVDAVEKKDTIADIGPKTIEQLVAICAKAKTVVWNGPFGIYEKGFVGATKTLLLALSKQKKTRVIIGGGDIVTVVGDLGLTDSFTHVSTGGGATLEFLAKGTLPGIEALG